MPGGYDVPFEEYGSVSEQGLGRGSEKRSTKTFIENGSLAMMLGFFRALPSMDMNVGRRLWAEERGVDPSSIDNEAIFQEFPEARELIGIHQEIVEHKGSVEGFLVDRFVGGANREDLDRHEERKPTSGEARAGPKAPSGGGERWK